jgi:HopA1 effector protein family
MARVSVHGHPEGRLSRLYFNVSSEVALRLLDEFVDSLEDKSVRFSIKALANPLNYFHRDAVVRYVATAAAEDILGHCLQWFGVNRVPLE